jgi:hypothetical protein
MSEQFPDDWETVAGAEALKVVPQIVKAQTRKPGFRLRTLAFTPVVRDVLCFDRITVPRSRSISSERSASTFGRGVSSPPGLNGQSPIRLRRA